MLDGLEKELKAVKKAREALGDKAPTFSRGWNRDRDHGPGVLGKRRRGSNASSSEEDIPEDVRNIPMPRDTPPPIPKEVMDQWYAKRRARRETEKAANKPEGEERTKTETPPVEPKTVYSAEPVRRDLQKEAVAAFVPSVVQRKLTKGRGQGGLMEPEEADRLESEGYLKRDTGHEHRETPPTEQGNTRAVTMEEVEDEEG